MLGCLSELIANSLLVPCWEAGSLVLSFEPAGSGASQRQRYPLVIVHES